METLIIFAGMIAVIWTPHIVQGITTRVRYAYRQRTGYTPTHGGIEQ